MIYSIYLHIKNRPLSFTCSNSQYSLMAFSSRLQHVSASSRLLDLFLCTHIQDICLCPPFFLCPPDIRVCRQCYPKRFIINFFHSCIQLLAVVLKRKFYGQPRNCNPLFAIAFALFSLLICR